MNLKAPLIKGKKRSDRSSVLSMSVALFATSTLSLLASPVAVQSINSVDTPTVGTVESMVTGDLMCYVTLVDGNGTRHKDVGATFEICQNKVFLNKKVNLTYKQVPVNDCQSAEPCGKTRLQTLIIQMTVVNDPHACGRGASAGYTIPRLQVGIAGHSVAEFNLRIRAQPGVESQSVSTLAPGSSFRVLEGPECASSYVWWKVSTGRVQGWVAEADPVTFTYWLAPNTAQKPR